LNNQTSVLTADLDSSRVGAGASRRDLFIWVSAIILCKQLLGVAKEAPAASLDQLLSSLSTVGVFQIMAWFAIFRLFAAADSTAQALLRDVLILAALCLLVFLPTVRMIWATALGAAVLAIISSKGDPKLRAAAIVLAALSVQEFWGHIFFNFFAIYLLDTETAIVGTALQIIRAGVVWRDNIVTAPDGHGLIIYSTCSSFNNVSLATLCWVTISKLQSEYWHTRDFIVGLIVVAVMIILNVVRMCLMAWNVDLYLYWHEGAGVQIFATSATLAILLLSFCGSRPAGLAR
jgi:hypothetical protein